MFKARGRDVFGMAMALTVATAFFSGTVHAADGDAASADTPGVALNDKDRAMIDTLTGARLVGSFTSVGGAQPDKLNKESYTIVSVTKLRDNLFLFRARIQYGDRDVTVPMPLPVIWSGDTPVITLTNATLPGLGTFSARVLFHDGKYSGTWRHGKHHGHLFGTIEKPDTKEAEAK